MFRGAWAPVRSAVARALILRCLHFPAGYFFDTPDGWGSYNLWNRDGKPDGVGYYKAEKNCDDKENCFIQFWCLDDNGDLYHNC